MGPSKSVASALSVCAVPAGDLVLVDAVQEARPRFLPGFVAPWVVWNHIVLRLGDSPDGRWSPPSPSHQCYTPQCRAL